MSFTVLTTQYDNFAVDEKLLGRRHLKGQRNNEGLETFRSTVLHIEYVGNLNLGISQAENLGSVLQPVP
jgi:hypothetical protein